MRRYIPILMIVFLGACGGNGDSSSGGASGDNPYAGNYAGTLKVTATGPGGTISDTSEMVATVTDNGQILARDLSDTVLGVSCSGMDPVYLNGNSFDYSDTYTCNVPDVGTCKANETGSGSINENTASMKGSLVLTCPSSTVTADITFSGTKQM